MLFVVYFQLEIRNRDQGQDGKSHPRGILSTLNIIDPKLRYYYAIIIHLNIGSKTKSKHSKSFSIADTPYVGTLPRTCESRQMILASILVIFVYLIYYPIQFFLQLLHVLLAYVTVLCAYKDLLLS